MCEELSRFNPIKSLSVDLCMDYSAATHELGSGRCLPPRLLDSTQHPAGLLSLSRSQQASRAAEPEEPVPTEPAVSPSGTTVCRARLGACRLHPGSDQPGLRIWSTVVCPPGGSPAPQPQQVARVSSAAGSATGRSISSASVDANSLNLKLPVPFGIAPLNVAQLPLQAGAPYASVPRTTGLTSYGTPQIQRR